MALDLDSFTSMINTFTIDKTLVELIQDKDNGYVKRWIVRGGTIVVTETGQPNLWMSRSTFELHPELKVHGVEFEVKTELHRSSKLSPGRHSGVHSTWGFGNIDLVKFRFSELEDLQKVILLLAADSWKPLP